MIKTTEREHDLKYYLPSSSAYFSNLWTQISKTIELWRYFLYNIYICFKCVQMELNPEISQFFDEDWAEIA